MTPTKAQWVERSPLWVALGAAAWAGFLGVLWVIPVLWVGERQGRPLQAALGVGWMALMWGGVGGRILFETFTKNRKNHSILLIQ